MYYSKYLKYKHKYLNLKGDLNISELTTNLGENVSNPDLKDYICKKYKDVNITVCYKDKALLFRPQYYFIASENIDNKKENISYNPFIGLYNPTLDITSDKEIINNINQSNFSTHDNLVSSNDTSLNWDKSNNLAIWSIMSNYDGKWSKAIITLHWLIDEKYEKKLLDELLDESIKTIGDMLDIINNEKNLTQLKKTLNTLIR